MKREGCHRRQSPERLRCYHPQTERIIFAEQHGQTDHWALMEDSLRGDAFAPLRNWLKTEFDRAGWTAADLNRICGTRSMAGRHYTARSQWAFPTEAHYLALQAAAPPGVLGREYDCLRREYDCLRRPFRLTGKAGMTDVWTLDTVPYRPGKHPCQKPVELMAHILNTSVRPGGIVLDPFAGSGTTGVACVQEGFDCILVERADEYIPILEARVAHAQGIGPITATRRPAFKTPAPVSPAQLSLLDDI